MSRPPASRMSHNGASTDIADASLPSPADCAEFPLPGNGLPILKGVAPMSGKRRRVLAVASGGTMIVASA